MPFPAKMTKATKEQTLKVLTESLKSFPEVKNLQFISMADLSPQEKALFFEHYMIKSPPEETRPAEGVFIADGFLALINIGDHLTLELIENTREWESVSDLISNLETHLSKSLNFSFSGNFGFLTSNFEECGTGLIVESYIHVPALIHMEKRNDPLSDLDEKISLSGFLDDSELVGDIALISNTFKLGVSEDDIIQAVHEAATSLTHEEASRRVELKEKGCPQMRDQVAKAFGLLKYSYLLETTEALSALSLIQLGSDLGWVKGDVHFSSLFFNCQDAHLHPAEDLPKARAEYFQAQLQNVDLVA